MIRRSSLASSVFATLVLLACGPAFGSTNAVYDAVCAFCHQTGAVGLRGQFPRLAGRVDVMAADPAARIYLIQAVMFGSSGKIEVDGVSYMGVMPPFASLSDAEIADVLNYLIRLAGKPAKRVKSMSAAEVKAVRDAPRLTSTEVSTHRKKLVADKAIP